MSHEVLKLALDNHWAKLNEKWAREYRASYGAINYLNEVATLTLDLGRRSGHTSFIIENATSDDLVVVSNWKLRDEFVRARRDLRIVSIGGRTVAWLGMKVRRIWIDNYSFLDYHVRQDDLDYNYTSLMHTFPEQVIRLG